ncbi:MAG: radical SAM family heme chaperone HemW [Alphaproteobacteria bacterium]
MTPVTALGGGPGAGFGVYIHWPFCLSKCPYCDFNSHVRDAIDEGRWTRALLSGLDHAGAATPGREVSSIFFGGGTPSLMPPDTAAALIERVRDLWPCRDELEITLEANPGAAETGRFAGFAAAGVNRLSLGVQSFHDEALRFLGRGHDRAEAIAAVERARALFPRHSFDLIYALPGQSLASLRAELSEALALTNGHLSLYQLTIEPGTAFHTAHRLGKIALPGEEDAARLYEAATGTLAEAGLHAYEVSNYARPGQECRHNLTYWRYGEYVGIGPGAHGRVVASGGAKNATRQIRLPEAWLRAIESDGHGSEEPEILPPRARLEELLMMGLRLTEGVPRARIEEEAGRAFDAALRPTALAPLTEAGFLICDAAGLRATPAGRLRLDAVLAALLA